MADDIVTRLRSKNRMVLAPLHMTDAADEIERLRAERDDWQREFHTANSELGLAVDQIERLRAEVERLRSALAIAAGMLSTREPYTGFHPEDILKMLIEEASRG